MTAAPNREKFRGGATLIEAVIAIGVLSIAVPMIFGALGQAGNSNLAARAETRSAWIVPVCMDEIRASRDGSPRYFTATATGEAFPPDGDVWALAFSVDGKPVGKLSKAQYDAGVRKIGGEDVRYIASMSAVADTAQSGATPMMRVDISLEYPSGLKATRRDKLDFHTRTP